MLVSAPRTLMVLVGHRVASVLPAATGLVGKTTLTTHLAVMAHRALVREVVVDPLAEYRKIKVG